MLFVTMLMVFGTSASFSQSTGGTIASRMMSINHFAEEYIGDHGNKIWSKDGRVLHDLLPFFNDYLGFE